MKGIHLVITKVLLIALPSLAQISNPAEFNNTFMRHAESADYLTEYLLAFFGEEK